MSRKVWLVSSRFAVRNGWRLPSSSMQLVAGDPHAGSTRTSVRFSSARRSGPGCIVVVPVGA